MAIQNYPACLAFTLQFEGGYVNHPRDPGGETNRGVTKRVYDAYRARKGRPIQSVRNISESEVQEIYRRQYWDAVRGDDLPKGVDACVFDLAVNSGTGRAARMLQQALGVKVDGNIGMATIAAAQAADPAKLVRDLVARREAFLKSLRTFPTFGKGWMRRTGALRKLALGMVG
jgi:lysozyme family protein